MNIVETVLELENVTMQFGGVVAVDSFSMHVDQGETVALIGPNGAGKTTAFNVITGVYAPTNGCVKLRGKIIAQGHPTGKMRKLYAGTHIGEYNRLVSNTPDRITEMGVARTFQNIRLFKNMTVLENVLVARHMRLKAGLFTSMLHFNQQEERRIRQESLDLLDMLGLGDFIRKIKEDFKLTVFLIEHHMNLVMDISDRIYVLDFGKLISEGTPQQVQDDPAVIAAYLGVDEE